MEDENDIIIKRIQEIRNDHSLSVQKFAEKIGVAKSTCYRWERGDIRTLKTEYIKKMSDIFNVSPLWLIGDNVPKEKETESHRSKRAKISNALYKVKEGDLDKLLVIVSAFVGEELK